MDFYELGDQVATTIRGIEELLAAVKARPDNTEGRDVARLLHDALPQLRGALAYYELLPGF